MTTVVPRQDLVLARRMLSENLRFDDGKVRIEGTLLRYEKGTITKVRASRASESHQMGVVIFSASATANNRDCNRLELEQAACHALRQQTRVPRH